ncbi:MAG: general stress protein [Candidatus Thiodiazotropha sp.]
MANLAQQYSADQANSRTRRDVDEFHQAVIGVFDTHAQAEATIVRLQQQGFPVDALTLVGKGYHSEERPLGIYTLADRVKAWGGTGLVIGALWGLLFGAAFFWFPDISPLGLSNPLPDLLAASAEGALAVGLLTGLVATLISLLLPNPPLLRYQGTLKAERFLLMTSGDAMLTETARRLMDKLTRDESGAVPA